MTSGDAPKTTRPYSLITVSSDIGFNGDGGGWFTNWVNRHTKLGKSQWETYDSHELIPWIDANLATIASRDGRAVAGLSQGGYGSTELAARHPDLFTQMAAFSGAPEIDRDVTVRTGAYFVIGGTMVELNGVPAYSPFGDPVRDQINWAGHDPAYLIPNLRGMGLWFATADGLPGKYDDPVTNPTGTAGSGFIESLTHASTDAFLRHLREANVAAVDYDYGTGTHTWDYWARDLRHFIRPLMHRFNHPVAPPAKVTYISIDPRWSHWGWSFSVRRAERLQFERLMKADANGFVLSGSGTAIVTTPKDFRPNHRYVVQVGDRRLSLQAAANGRLPIVVQLGSKPSQVRVRIEH
jgi:S-formylglutathione hydrolase FrmB